MHLDVRHPDIWLSDGTIHTRLATFGRHIAAFVRSGKILKVNSTLQSFLHLPWVSIRSSVLELAELLQVAHNGSRRGLLERD